MRTTTDTNRVYRLAVARLATALLRLQDAVNGVLALDPEGYQPETGYWDGREMHDHTWVMAVEESELLVGVLRHVASSVGCTLAGGLEGYAADVAAEEELENIAPDAVSVSATRPYSKGAEYAR